ncbi:hypothetical protein ACNFCJ_23945, partial [Pseudomonas sp. NY15364]|uniref:hypothetical protein n=1 Tax=Pseudomonas sp. NY15364 TaxID=3400353 RepID=UPI003A84A026
RYSAPGAHDSRSVVCSLLSMANHHPKVAKLAKDLAYRKGEVLTLTTREHVLLAELEEIRGQKQAAEQVVAELSDKIRAFELDAGDVRGIRATPRKEGVRHGAFRKALTHALQMTRGALRTSEILARLQLVEDPEFGLPDDHRDAMHRIARDLRVLRDRGCVVRTDGGGAGVEASWLWVGVRPTVQESS